MAMVTVNPFYYPNIFEMLPANTTVGVYQLLDVAGEYLAIVAQATEDMTISHVYLDCQAVVGSPTADIRIETVDASGLPSGTLWATNTNKITGTLTTTGTIFALTAAASISRSQVWCLKFVYNSGTSLSIGREGSNWNMYSNLPYSVTNTSGSPVRTGILGSVGRFAVGSSTSVMYDVEGMLPELGRSGNTFNNTNSAAQGVRFTLPFKARCIGFAYYNFASTGTFNYFLADSTGAELSSSSTAFDPAQSATTIGDSFLHLYFDNAVTLVAGTEYILAVEPTSATNANCPFITFDASLLSPTGHSWYQNAKKTQRSSGSWTNSTTDLPNFALLLDQLDDGA